jgi:cytochrome c-type biogenesis protein
VKVARPGALGPAPALRYGLLVFFVIALGLAGYGGFRLYPRLALPAADGVGLLSLGVAAGIAAFFSPCSFPLLATLLARAVDPARRVATALFFATTFAAGAATFLLLFGLVISAGAAAALGGVRFTSAEGRILRSAVGIALILLGLAQLGLISAGAFHRVSDLARPLQRVHAEERRAHPARGYALFGFGYVLAGFG